MSYQTSYMLYGLTHQWGLYVYQADTSQSTSPRQPASAIELSPLALLLASYLHLEPQTTLDQLLDVFAEHLQTDKQRSQSCKRLIRTLATKLGYQDKTPSLQVLAAALTSDITQFTLAFQKSNAPAASQLYHAPLFQGIEHTRISNAPRKHLLAWLVDKREQLHQQGIENTLQHAELLAAQDDYPQSKELTLKASSLINMVPLAVSPASWEDRLHTLLCAHNMSSATDVLFPHSKSLHAPNKHSSPRRAMTGMTGLAVTRRRKTLTSLSQEQARTTLRTPHNLPSTNVPLVGREQQLKTLHQALREQTRLITLSGAPGVGKSHLGLELAHQQRGWPWARDGVFCLFLDRVPKGDGWLYALQDTLGIRSTGKDLWQCVLQECSQKKLVLVLDNFDHFTQEKARLSELLRTCPELRIILTSRTVLDLPEEYVLILQGLAYPMQEALTHYVKPITTASYPALDLFEKRAKMIMPSFSLTAEELPNAVKICHLTDGLPLAISLAASWISTCSCATIAQGIEQDLTFLAQTHGHLHSSHHSIIAAFDYSWQLLVPAEKQALRRVSVFVGNFTTEAAYDVCDVSLQELIALSKLSLLSPRHGRYSWHPLIHKCAEAQLAKDPKEHHSIRAKHAAHYVAQVDHISLNTFSTSDTSHLTPQDLSQDLNNIEVAWRYSIQHTSKHITAKHCQKLSFLYHSLNAYGRISKLLDETHQLGQHHPLPTTLLHTIRYYHADFLHLQGKSIEAARHLELLLGMCDQHDLRLCGRFSYALFNIWYRLGYLDKMQMYLPMMQKSWKHVSQIQQIRWLCSSGCAHILLGHYKKALRYLHASYDRSRLLLLSDNESIAHIDGRTISWSSQYLGYVYWCLGRPEKAEHFLLLSQEYADKASTSIMYTRARAFTAFVQAHRGCDAQAYEEVQACHTIATRHHMGYLPEETLIILADISLYQQEIKQAYHHTQHALTQLLTREAVGLLYKALTRWAALHLYRKEPEVSHRVRDFLTHPNQWRHLAHEDRRYLQALPWPSHPSSLSVPSLPQLRHQGLAVFMPAPV